jgi:hypothetical protein
MANVNAAVLSVWIANFSIKGVSNSIFLLTKLTNKAQQKMKTSAKISEGIKIEKTKILSVKR